MIDNAVWLGLQLLFVTVICLILFLALLLDYYCRRGAAAHDSNAAGEEATLPHEPLLSSSVLHRLQQRVVSLSTRACRAIALLSSTAVVANVLPSFATAAAAAASSAAATTSVTRKRSTSSTSSASSSPCSPQSPSSSPSSSPFPPASPIRLNLVSTDGIANCYRVVASLPLQHVVAFYLQRLHEKEKAALTAPLTASPAAGKEGEKGSGKRKGKHAGGGGGGGKGGLVVPASVSGLSVGGVVLRYQGRKLPLDATAEEAGLVDMAVIGQSPPHALRCSL